jgi:two-component system sensor histidine kinase RstB/two-component system sensor kinase ParS
MKRIFFSFFLFVTVTIVVMNLAFSPLAERAILYYLKNVLNAYYSDLTKGTFHMLMEDLRSRPESQWPQRIDRLQDHFGYPIDLKRLSEIEMTGEEHTLLVSHQVVTKDDGSLFYLRVRDSRYALIMGPVKDPEMGPYGFQALIWGAAIVVVAFLALLWAMPFWRKLKRIITASQAFGSGRLDTRARVPRRSALAPLADAFNGMADRIQGLIDAQRELTNAVSHELRTPISRIRFSLEMLGEATRVSDRKHYLSEMSQDIDELDELVTESLIYARFDRGAPQIDWQSRLPEPWLRKVTSNATKGLGSIKFSCTNRLSQTDREIRLEPRYMGRALGNLIQNAATYANGRIAVVMADDGGDCLIHVDDDGPGIPEADRRRVFQAFTRLDTSRDRDTGGFGLGLAIVQRVVTWHEGRVEISRSPLGGARLTIRWPGFPADEQRTSNG